MRQSQQNQLKVREREAGAIAFLLVATLSLAMLTAALLVSMTAAQVRQSSLEYEWGQRARYIADSCLEIALMRLFNFGTAWSLPERFSIGDESCEVVQVTALAGWHYLVRSRAAVPDQNSPAAAFANLEAEVVVSPSEVRVVWRRYLPKF